MRTSPALPWLAALLLLTLATPSAASAVHHAIQVSIDPDAHRLAVHDSISLPEGAADTLIFRLHAGLSPRVAGDGAKLTLLGSPAGDGTTPPLETYRVDLEPGARHFSLRYGGEIHHPVGQHGEEYARSFAASPGLIGADGVFLGGASHWYPRIVGAPYLSFELAVSLPAAWRSVSQGYRTRGASANGRVAEIWREARPQEEIYLVAARFTEYERPGAQADALVFLREPDEALAERYLELTGRYLRMYEELIGPYPYGKFALVENFWETGYGMPSFTLLGPQVIRLPFIPYTSYPHEILHNWWGNGVYVDFASGNWSEGLTSYLADHLLKAQRGQGA
ncbi:MAG: peptidase M28, partial [Chromatiales bacterium]